MKYFIGIVIGIAVVLAGTAIASSLQPDIIGAGESNRPIGIGTGYEVRRFYDRDNGIVCWVATNSTLINVPAISCIRVQ